MIHHNKETNISYIELLFVFLLIFRLVHLFAIILLDSLLWCNFVATVCWFNGGSGIPGLPLVYRKQSQTVYAFSYLSTVNSQVLPLGALGFCFEIKMLSGFPNTFTLTLHKGKKNSSVKLFSRRGETNHDRKMLKHEPESADINEEQNERLSVAQLCVTEQTCVHLFCLGKKTVKWATNTSLFTIKPSESFTAELES